MHRWILTIAFLPLLAHGQLSTYGFYGYVKYMYSSAKIPGIEQRSDDHLLHSRLHGRWYPNYNLTAAMDIRMRVYYGESIQHSPRFLEQIQQTYDLADLNATIWNKEQTVGLAEIDRLYLDYTLKDWQLTAGRQRIAWGTALVWNVIDLFNPKSVLDFDYEANPGADALRIQYYTGAVSRLELAVKPGDNRYNRTIAGMWKSNAFGYDWYVLAAWYMQRKITGLAWAGDISGAGFRGEVTFGDALSEGPDTIAPIPPFFGLEPLNASDQYIVHAVLSLDYTWSNSLYLHGEALYNNVGRKNYAALYRQQAYELGLLSPARWSLYQEMAYDLTPLIRGTIFNIFNPDDHSYIMVPSITWSVKTNLDLLLLAFFPEGERYSEFGAYGNSFFARFKYSF